MPPTRRNTNTPPPKGRRPKIAGQAAVRRASAEPADRQSDDQQVPDGPVAETVGDTAQADSSVPGQAVVEPPVEPASDAPPAADAEPDAAEGAKTAPTPESPTPEATAPSRRVNRTSALRPRQRPEEVGAGSGETTADSAAVRAGWKRVGVIGAVAAALAAFAVVAAFEPGGDVPNRAWVDTAETTQVTAAARNAIQTLYTYKFDTVDQDFDNARAVLTEGMRTEFDTTAQVTRDAVVQTKTATNAQVTDIGVKLLGDDRAELVASMNVSASNDGVAQGSAEGPLSVTMAKVDGSWLLSDIRDR